jgi:hypothetical protein
VLRPLSALAKQSQLCRMTVKCSYRMPMLFSRTIGAAIAADYWFLRARRPPAVPMSICGRWTGTAARP